MGVIEKKLSFSEDDKKYMREALNLAKKAFQLGEIPVGSVIVLDGLIIGRGFNLAIKNCDPTAHSEIIALRKASKKINNYRLCHSTLYTTLEPCFMCVGAIVHARVRTVIFGTVDSKAGAVVSKTRGFDYRWLNHHVNYAAGLYGLEAENLLREFFQECRKR